MTREVCLTQLLRQLNGCGLSRPVEQLQEALSRGHLASPRERGRLRRQELVCLVGRDSAQMRAGAAAAAAAGHEHLAVLEGGLAAFDAADLAQVWRGAVA